MIGERNSSLPLPLLIIIGKSRGEGDYYNYENKKLVGTGCDSISFVEITMDPKMNLDMERFISTFVINEIRNIAGF